MIQSSIREYLIQLLSEKLKQSVSSLKIFPVGGGSINDTYKISADNNNFFLKLNTAEKYPALFEKEKKGLEFISSKKIILAAAVVDIGIINDRQFLLLDWIEGGLKTELFWKKFGEQLAKLHYITNDHFGFIENNYMGALPQLNSLKTTWIDFFIDCRLKPQIKMANEKKLLPFNDISKLENLFSRLESVFNGEKPSLLHGDLWSGNFMCNENAKPVLIDPAVYFGHRSIDLAMTTLFGGFDKQFYESYNYHFPFPSNYREQWEICNLYPLLIHLNLFGSGYLGQIEAVLRKYN